MTKRNSKNVFSGKFQSELITKAWAKINRSGIFGQVELPSDTDAIAFKNDINVNLEYNDEKTGAKTNSRNGDYAPIRMKGKTKITLSSHLHATKSNIVEAFIGKFMELLLGKREVISADRGASITISDPHAVKAGLVLTTASTLLGNAGNYVTLVLVNGGASGTEALSVDGYEYTLTYYNDSTVADVVTVLDANSLLVCAADAIGTAATDLFIDLLSSNALASGAKLYAAGGASKGFLYSNEDAPVDDMTLIFNKHKTGAVVPGCIFDKFSLEIADNIPSLKIEGMGKKHIISGGALLTIAAVAGTKLYLGSEYKQFSYDASCPAYIDVMDNDGLTYKSKANKIVGSGTDGTGNYVEVLNAVTADINDHVVFHEPENYNPLFNPMNGMSGSVELDGIVLEHKKNFKMEYSNNHQVFENHAFTDTIEGYNAAKMVTCKMSVEILLTESLIPLVKKLQAKEIAVIPMKVVIGNETGSMITIMARNLSVKSPDLADKADESTSFTVEGEICVTPETADKASVTWNQH